MGLINLQTNLKSLKFGKDRPGGGDSGQPFIQKPIPDSPSSNIGLGTDALIRGGILAPQRALEDVKRLSRYLFNPKSPSGLLFTLKENLLSRTSVKTEASKGLAYGGGKEWTDEAVNAGIYTPLSTLAQAGVAGLGGHLNQKGIDPTGLIQPLSINKYEDVIKGNNRFTENLKIINPPNPTMLNPLNPITGIKGGDGGFGNKNILLVSPIVEGITKNRLLSLWQTKQIPLYGNGLPLLEYGGGPGSILGVGKTRINFASERTGINNKELKEFYSGGFLSFTHDRSKVFTKDSINFNNYLGISKKLGFNTDVTGISENGKEKEKGTITIGGENPNALFNPNPINYPRILDLELNKALFKEDSKNPHKNKELEFDTYIVAVNKRYNKPDSYKNVNIERRVNLGNPGGVEGKFVGNASYNNTDVLDKINGSRIYSSSAGLGSELNSPLNDLVAFRIGVINPNNPTGSLEYMNFRSYIDSFSDSYSSNWKSQTYMGRGEKFYKYQDFDRSISMAFTVVAQSQGEMNGMYQKLNFLASSLAPTYTPLGYMAGNLVKMTVGDYIYEQVGFISSLTYDIPQDSSWELSLTPNIGIDTTNNPDELPFMIKVTGLKFTPIHNFRPEKSPTNRFITHKIPFTPNYNNIK